MLVLDLFASSWSDIIVWGCIAYNLPQPLLTGIQMAKFTGGAVPLIARPHDISTHGGLLHHINISYNSTEKPIQYGPWELRCNLCLLQSNHILLII